MCRALAMALRALGFTTAPDHTGWHSIWDGGRSGTQVRVTNREIAAVAYLEDRALPDGYGEPTPLEQIRALAALHAC